MILRKTPSVFLRALRSLSPDALPALPEKKLSAAQQKRLEQVVFSRIVAEQNRTIFDTVSDSAASADETFLVFLDSGRITQIGGRGAWKYYLKNVLAACLCFALLVSAVLLGGRLARLTGRGDSATDTESAHMQVSETTTPLKETGVPYPGEDAEGFSLQMVQAGVHDQTGYLTLQVTLTKDGEPMQGIAVQYRRVTLSLWDPDVRVWRAKYGVFTSNQPKAEIMAGDLHFSLNGQGQTASADAVITIPSDIRGFTGVWGLSLEGLTLVRNSSDPTDPENTLVTEVLTEGAVHTTFFSKCFAVFPHSGEYGIKLFVE